MHPITQGEARPGSSRHWLVAAGAAMLMVGASFMFLSFSLVNPPLAESLGVGLSQVMLYNSIMALAGAVSMTAIAPWALARFGARTLVVAGGAWTALCLFGFSFATSLAMLYVLALLMGVTFALCTNLAASVLVNAWFEAYRGTVLGAVFAVSGLGGIAMGLVMPGVVASSGWETGFRLLAVLLATFTIVPGLLLIRSAPANVGLRPFGASTREVDDGGEAAHVVVPGVPRAIALRTPQFAGLVAAIVLVVSVHAMQQHLAPLMTERGVSLATAGTLISLLSFASIFGTTLMGAINDRVSTLVALWVALGFQLASLVGFVLSFGFLPLAVSIVLFAFGAAMPLVLVPILVMLVFGLRDYAAILGPTMAAGPVGMALGTPLWGLALDRTGSYTAGLMVAAVVTVVAALLLTWVVRTAPGLRARVARELDQGYGAD